MLKDETKILTWIKGFNDENIIVLKSSDSGSGVEKIELKNVDFILFCKDFPNIFNAEIKFKNGFVLQTQILYYKSKMLYYKNSILDKRINYLDVNKIESVKRVNELVNVKSKNKSIKKEKPVEKSKQTKTKNNRSPKPKDKDENIDSIVFKESWKNIKSLIFAEKMRVNTGVLVFFDMKNNRFAGFELGIRFFKYSRIACGYASYNGGGFPYLSYQVYFDFLESNWKPFAGIIYPVGNSKTYNIFDIFNHRSDTNLYYNLIIGMEYRAVNGLNFSIFSGYSKEVSIDKNISEYTPVLGFNTVKNF